ncbi:MAG: glutathione S-transferase N-terminal domain-containing protein [Proteobacteria bacterium]|nr:glutathione S-transferase N-terminal domain-containing protein [Pseudomonadota bacterium]
MLHIWGRISSINVRKVVWAVQYLNLAHRRTDAGGQFGIVKTPDYLAHNPNALVPLLEDGDFRLWESNVILRYLCARHAPGTLYPQELKARFDAERWMDWQQTTLNPAGRDAFVQLIRRPGGRVDATRVDASVAATTPLLDLLDAHLARQPFMAGSQLTMADIPIACEIHRWRGTPLPHQPRAHLDRWYQHMLALPASRGVLDIVLS